MKLLVFGSPKNEQEELKNILKTIPLEHVDFADGIYTKEQSDLVKGYDGISILSNSRIGEAEAKALHEAGVKYILTRSTGIDHLDVDALKNYGIKASNVPAYSPNAISEHTILLFLSLLRKMKRNQRMIRSRNYGIQGICGREARMMTVGVVGCGRIGSLTIRALHGLGAKVVIYSPIVNEALKEIAEYVSFEELLQMSDAIILHCPLTEENYHMINRDTLKQCKENLILVNTARGGLMDAEAVLEGLKSGRIEAFGMDVYEQEDDFVRKDYQGASMGDVLFEELTQREDVIYTAHVGFLTDQALYEMLYITIENAKSYEDYDKSDNEVTQI